MDIEASRNFSIFKDGGQELSKKVGQKPALMNTC